MTPTTEQLNAINRLYSNRRLDAARLKDARLAELKSKVPGYDECCTMIMQDSITAAKEALKGHNKSKNPDILKLIRRKQDLIESAGYPADYLEDVYYCRRCRDTGYIDGQRCTCMENEIISILYNQSGLKEYLKELDFSKVSSQYYTGEHLNHFKSTLTKCHNFVDRFPSFDNLILYGTVGTGKTLLSQCIAKALIEKGFSVIYYSASSLMDIISRETFDYSRRGDTTGGMNLIYNCDLLIIDDLGTEMSNNFTVSSLFSLINERFLLQKSIVISTNLLIEDIRTRYTDRIFSRLTGAFTFCRLSGPDIRIANKAIQKNNT